MRSHRDGYPPLPSDVMPDVTSADDDGYAYQGYDRVEHVRHLRAAHFHVKECARCLRQALAALDDEELGPEGDDEIEPTDFGDYDDNQKTERARRAALMVLRSLA
jgi:hypothetical protein